MNLPAKFQEIKDRHAKAGIVDWTKSLAPQDLGKHKAMIGAELEKVSLKLDRFGWATMEDAMRQALYADWMEVLAPYGLNEVKDAVRALTGSDNPKDAFNEQKVKAEILRARKERLAAIPKERPAEEPKAHVPAERREEILRTAGFAVKRFPKVGDAG
jgi:hypothetical protein